MSAILVGAALLAAVPSACTPAHSRLQPFRDSPAAQATLERRAAEIAGAPRESAQPSTRGH